MHFTSVSKTNPSYGIKTRSYGDLQFGRSQVAASSIISTIDYGVSTRVTEDVAELLGLEPDKLTGPTHTITIKDTSYISGGLTDILLPPGKTWLKSKGFGTQAGLGGSAINVLSPRELKLLLADVDVKKAGGVVDGVPTTVYSGSNLFRTDLLGFKVSFKVNWKLWIGNSDGLIRRIASNENILMRDPEGKVKPFRLQLSSDTYLTNWGKQVWIYAPDERLVEDLTTSLTLPSEVLGSIDLGD
ncbi:hypothetical protein Acor_33120 [Acrocarpospora corrugata]|uniref:Uncharacterized protein n=1 Tax=Acrocarpospora corrugata TaxID=35763 RepID=A0A5M3W3S1_9ACTN|nr:hypothetical protein [Acrocarpospora corrugata]GES01248.1 hypothetical protein Acor_33120 [Acrocarpospora corrugata]